MSFRLMRITKELKKYDRELYCAELPSGKPAIFRRTTRSEVHDLEGSSLIVYKDAPHLVFSLTHDWSVKGEIVDWGIEPILARLKAIDLWANGSFMDDLIKNHEDAEKEQSRKDRNNIESFFYDQYSTFKKDWKDINTASLAKKDRRRLDEKKIKNN